MTFLSPSILLIFLLGSSELPLFQQFAVESAEDQVSTMPELELTSRIVERKYCYGGGMLLILESKYKNVGEANLILFKYAQSPFEYRVSQSNKAARAKKYEQVISPMMGSGPSLVHFGDEPPNDYFVILGPGQSYTPVNTITVPMFIVDANRKSSRDYLAPGEHVLQLNISTWPFENLVEEELRTRWQRFGILRTKPVLSLPMVFQVERPNERSLSDCNAASERQSRSF